MNGDIDGALQILRDIHDSDGRTVLFLVLSRKRDEKTALAWFDDQSEIKPDLFTGLGWCNLAICLCHQNRWDEASSVLASVREQREAWPDMAYVEGVINTALMLPVEIRCYLFESPIFLIDIRPNQGNDVEKFRSYAKECFESAFELLKRNKIKDRAYAAQNWLLWLRLTDPNPDNSSNAVKEIQEAIRGGVLKIRFHESDRLVNF